MPLLLPPACSAADLELEAPPRYIAGPGYDGYGAIVQCQPPYSCARWRLEDPLPVGWVEITDPNIAAEVVRANSCPAHLVSFTESDGLAVPSDAAPSRPADSPVRARTARPPRPPRNPRRPRAPRLPRRPRAPREARDPREPRPRRDQQVIMVLARGWAGWPQATLRPATIQERRFAAVPHGGEFCIVDHAEAMDAWSAMILRIGNDADVREMLRGRFGTAGICSARDIDLCRRAATQAAAALDTLQSLWEGRDLARVRLDNEIRRRAARAAAPAAPTTAPTPTEPTAPAPEAPPAVELGEYVYYGSTPTSTLNGQPFQGTLGIRHPLTPYDFGGGGQWYTVAVPFGDVTLLN